MNEPIKKLTLKREHVKSLGVRTGVQTGGFSVLVSLTSHSVSVSSTLRSGGWISFQDQHKV